MRSHTAPLPSAAFNLPPHPPPLLFPPLAVFSVPPVVAMSAPPTFSTFTSSIPSSPLSIPVAASACDVKDNLAYVAFGYADSSDLAGNRTLFATATSAPYNATLLVNATSVDLLSGAPFFLFAVATNTGGNSSALSTPVSVAVQSLPPPPPSPLPPLTPSPPPPTPPSYPPQYPPTSVPTPSDLPPPTPSDIPSPSPYDLPPPSPSDLPPTYPLIPLPPSPSAASEQPPPPSPPAPPTYGSRRRLTQDTSPVYGSPSPSPDASTPPPPSPDDATSPPPPPPLPLPSIPLRTSSPWGCTEATPWSTTRCS